MGYDGGWGRLWTSDVEEAGGGGSGEVANPPGFEPGSDIGGEAEGHWNEFPDNSISLIRVSIGVLPTRRTKNSCSITCDETVLREGSRSKSLPKRVGWLG